MEKKKRGMSIKAAIIEAVDKQIDSTEFCHRHRVLELEKGVGTDHVIIDLRDWKELERLMIDFICAICGKHPKDQPFNFLSHFKKEGRQHHSNWICDTCRDAIIGHKTKNPY